MSATASGASVTDATSFDDLYATGHPGAAAPPAPRLRPRGDLRLLLKLGRGVRLNRLP